MRGVNAKFGRIFLLATILILPGSDVTSAATISQWNYNDLNTTVDIGNGTQSLYFSGYTGPPFAEFGTPGTLPESPDPATGTADKFYNITLAGDGTTAPVTGMQWNVSTVGFENIRASIYVFEFALRYIPDNWRWAYSLDGTNFVSYTSSFLPDEYGWHLLSVDLSGIAGASNNPNFALRFFEDETLPFGISTRFDYVNINGTGAAVPIPAAAWLLGAGLVGLAALRRRIN